MQGFAVYLASRTEEENQILKRKLEPLRNEFDQLRFIGLHPQGLALSAQEKMAAVILNVPEWHGTEAAHLASLRMAGYQGPVLVSAKGSQSAAMKSLQAMDSVVFLEKPFDTKDLVGIVKKMLHARVVAQRIHRRFNTDESAEILPFGKNDSYFSRVCNISRGGAYLEFSTPAPIRTGDMVRVKVELRDVHRIYTVPARVVWMGLPLESSGQTAAGVQFVGTPDVRKTVLGEY